MSEQRVPGLRRLAFAVAGVSLAGRRGAGERASDRDADRSADRHRQRRRHPRARAHDGPELHPLSGRQAGRRGVDRSRRGGLQHPAGAGGRRPGDADRPRLRPDRLGAGLAPARAPRVRRQRVELAPAGRCGDRRVEHDRVAIHRPAELRARLEAARLRPGRERRVLRARRHAEGVRSRHTLHQIPPRTGPDARVGPEGDRLQRHEDAAGVRAGTGLRQRRSRQARTAAATGSSRRGVPTSSASCPVSRRRAGRRRASACSPVSAARASARPTPSTRSGAAHAGSRPT